MGRGSETRVTRVISFQNHSIVLLKFYHFKDFIPVVRFSYEPVLNFTRILMFINI